MGSLSAVFSGLLVLTLSSLFACSGPNATSTAGAVAIRTAEEQSLLDRRVEIAQRLHEVVIGRRQHGIVSREELLESQSRLLEARLAAARDSAERIAALEEAIAQARKREESLAQSRSVGQATSSDLELAAFDRTALEIQLARARAETR